MADHAGRPGHVIAVALGAYAIAAVLAEWNLAVWPGGDPAVAISLLEASVAVLAVLGALLVGRGDWHTVLRLRRAAPLTLLGAALLGFGFACGQMAFEMHSAIGPLGRVPQGTSTTVNVPVLLVAVVSLMPALGEEMLYRGLLLWAFERRAGKRVAVVLSAILFAAVHVPPLDVSMLAGLVAFGVLVGYLTLLSGSLLPAMACHACNNATAFWVLTLIRRAALSDDPGCVVAEAALVSGIAIAIGMVCLVVAHGVGTRARGSTADTHPE